jgi:CHAT domain-containing protein
MSGGQILIDDGRDTFTHTLGPRITGILANQLKGLSEPGLVFTPPTKGTDKDDGYLTAGEVAQLNLNADWVILSACNTAAPDGTPGAEGLTGLAKAFFYAGARSLYSISLVSRK